MAQARNILVVGGTGTIGGYIALEAHSHSYAVTISGRKPVKDISRHQLSLPPLTVTMHV